MPGNATICGACSAELGRALQSVRWLAAELETTLSRQTSKTGSGRSAETPLPFDPRASDAAHALRSTLVAWTRVLAEQTGDPWPEDSCERMAAWLSERLSWLVSHPAAVEAHGEILAAVRGAERVVDRAADRRYVGPCGAELDDGGTCDLDLYARPDAAQVTCRACGTAWDVRWRLDRLLDVAEDTLAHAALVAQALTRLGTPVTPERIRKWRARGRLVPHGHDGRGRPLYRIGDVIDLLAERQRTA